MKTQAKPQLVSDDIGY